MLPGQGVFDLDRFCDTLRAKGYDRPVSVEIISEAMRQLAPADFAARVFQATAPYWS